MLTREQINQYSKISYQNDQNDQNDQSNYETTKENQQEIKTITITINYLIFYAIKTILCLCCFIISISNWILLTNKERKTYRSILLFFYMMVLLHNFINYMIQSIIIFTVVDKTILETEYKNLFETKNYYLRILNDLIFFSNAIVLMLMATEFVPFTKENCYDYTYIMCLNCRIGAICGVIRMLICGLSSLYIILSFAYIYTHEISPEDQTFNGFINEYNQI